MKTETQCCDFIIIGSGISGLRAAIDVSKYGDVLILTKSKINEGSTEHAQGGVAVAFSSVDSPKFHFADTVHAGEGLCDAESVWILVKEGPKRVRELIEWGTKFDMKGTDFAFTGEGAHHVRRVIHHADATGHEIERSMIEKVKNLKNVKVIDYIFTLDFIVKKNRLYGVYAYKSDEDKLYYFFSKAIILASGGAGQIYSNTTNPIVATGDGIAMALRAGAIVTDMEFVQFHPTALAIETTPKFLISESVRGEGAKLINHKGERFMLKYHPMAELAPRDVVSRAIFDQMKKYDLKNVFLDLSSIKGMDLKERFSKIYNFCKEHGIDILTQPIPVHPSAHYMIGGIKTDLNGNTSINGLLAAGEVACLHVHGANRLASNSLLEGIVYGTRAGTLVKRFTRRRIKKEYPEIDFDKKTVQEKVEYRREIQQMMTLNAGIIRDEGSLKKLQENLLILKRKCTQNILDVEYFELENLIEVALLVTKFALKRTESRGVHFRKDYNYRDDKNWKRHLFYKDGEFI